MYKRFLECKDAGPNLVSLWAGKPVVVKSIVKGPSQTVMNHEPLDPSYLPGEYFYSLDPHKYRQL